MPRKHGHAQDANASTQPQGIPLFIDPMLGSPLSIFVEKDVDDRATIIDLILKHGGTVAPGYSGVTYILVDPYKPSGQSLYRQYVGKKTKVVLDARWVHECVTASQLQTFAADWAGCKVTGAEIPTDPEQPPQHQDRRRDGDHQQSTHASLPDTVATSHTMANIGSHPHPMQPQTLNSLVNQPFAYSVYTPLHASDPHDLSPSGAWPGANGIAPEQTNLTPPESMAGRNTYREDPWADPYDGQHAMEAAGVASTSYDYRYSEDQRSWVHATQFYDASQYHPAAYGHSHYLQEPIEADPAAGSSTAILHERDEVDRGRQRARAQAPARFPPARSPTPPARVVKSTYGGNLFTADDVLFIQKYITYCQEQGLILSLREICERIAVKAPHHTFYSWRRYCNKHQIRLAGYAMQNGRDEDTDLEDQFMDVEQSPHTPSNPATVAVRNLNGLRDHNRSPSPPRTLYRSTTGKGVAFTEEDVSYLVRFMQHRRSQGRLDMVAFWRDVATRAPHHSRASWMKYWRRHRHELDPSEGDGHVQPSPPEKKARYTRSDDILLANFFSTGKPDDWTSDRIFQDFARLNPHHPWKGWQEHYRVHKTKIDYIVQQIQKGEAVDERAAAA